MEAFWLPFGWLTDPKHVRCKICQRDIAYSGNTTNLKQHLINWHPEQCSSSSRGSAGAKQPTLEEFAVRPKPKMSSSSLKVMDIKRAIATFVVKDVRPVSIVEGEGFQHLMQVVEPTFVVPFRKTVMKEIRDMHEQVRAKVVTELGQATAQWLSPLIFCRPLLMIHTWGSLHISLLMIGR